MPATHYFPEDRARYVWNEALETAMTVAPGGTLEVEVLDIHALGWRWSAVISGFGPLAGDVPGPYLKTLRFD